MSDIRKNLTNKTIFETNQELLGMRNVIHVIVIKSWIGDNVDTSEDRKQNTIIVNESVLF